MFTGLIEAVGEVAAVRRTDAALQLRVRTSLAAELVAGDSLAVNGVCLTVTARDEHEAHADIGPETARVTTLGTLQPQDVVNLERPMRADARFGGHFVQGHVDGTGALEAIRADGESQWLRVSFPPDLAPFIIRKGSIAIDGISLTVADLGAAFVDVMIIPFTWEHTNLRHLRVGRRVNIECDMIGKYVARTMALTAGSQQPGVGAR